MQVSEVMHKGVSIAQINDTLQHVANIMKNEDIGAMPVYKNERPVGFVTDRDIVVSCLAQGKTPDSPVSLAMSQDIILVHETEDIAVAQKLMREHQISRLLVVDKGEQPVGMVSLHDLAINTDNAAQKAQVLNSIKR